MSEYSGTSADLDMDLEMLDLEMIDLEMLDLEMMDLEMLDLEMLDLEMFSLDLGNVGFEFGNGIWEIVEFVTDVLRLEF